MIKSVKKDVRGQINPQIDCGVKKKRTTLLEEVCKDGRGDKVSYIRVT